LLRDASTLRRVSGVGERIPGAGLAFQTIRITQCPAPLGALLALGSQPDGRVPSLPCPPPRLRLCDRHLQRRRINGLADRVHAAPTSNRVIGRRS
jgi:hypothetical protein